MDGYNSICQIDFSEGQNKAGTYRKGMVGLIGVWSMDEGSGPLCKLKFVFIVKDS